MKKFLIFLVSLVLILTSCAKKEKKEEVKEGAETKVEKVDTAAVDTARIPSEEAIESKVESVKEKAAAKPAVPAAKRAATRVASKPYRGNFTVQVSSWRTMSRAKQIASDLKSRGYDAYVQKAYIVEKDEIWYRVRIGTFQSYRAAKEVADELALITGDAWVDNMREDY